MKAINAVIIIMTFTICVVILSTLGTVILYPERASDGNAANIMDLLKFMLGIIAGYTGAIQLNKKD